MAFPEILCEVKSMDDLAVRILFFQNCCHVCSILVVDFARVSFVVLQLAMVCLMGFTILHDCGVTFFWSPLQA